MAKKNHYYVLVLTDEGAKFVTGIKPHHYAEYDMLKNPLELSKDTASDIAFGLTANFINAYTITAPYEINCQPYMYHLGNFEWKWKGFDRMCYELYKTDWLKRISAERQNDAIKNAYESEQTLEEYLLESGYNGECYACFEEFKKTEYKDKEYMKGLLNNENLYATYLERTKESEGK